MKQLAQSPEPGSVSKAQLSLGNHIFEVKERGASLFPYILEDAAFRIQLSRPGHKAPMAYVKVSAVYLAHVGPVEAEKHLYELLSQLGEVKESANVSRIDLFVDFQTSVNMESWDRHAWVTRASSINAYAVSGNFSGWSVGLGGVISARLYNKLLEIIVSGKDWILPLWQKAGWNGQGVIWRLEFELKREVLTQKNLSKLYEVLNHLNGLWSYSTTEWLRLTLPSDEDKTRSRWPTHPLWDWLSSVDWEGKGGPLSKRFSPARSPNDHKLFQIAYSAILSYMAKHGFPAGELYEGAEDFLANAYAYHEQKAYELGLSFDAFIAEKLALKHRQYNTAINDPEQEAKRQAKELEEQARAYRKASGN
ncbi:replication initiation factor [Dechloromonas sp. TW-R-39-2]|uniref:replication initiation factor n=1 Tax=Dechloromonas sp. TW-R-39-2 TaxID=2654218 RepID=UPI00193E0C7E|nr:replication initiation factor [Dechloromonas sp. TW-R-39-2]